MSALRPRLLATPWRSEVAAAAVGATALLAVAMAAEVNAIRIVVALLLLVDLIVISLAYPGTAIVLAVLLSLVIPLGRRLLIPLTGLTTFDPLLLIAPGFAVVTLYRLFLVEHRRLSGDPLSGAILVLLGITLLQVANPAGGGITAGMTGLLYVAVPLLWFFVGREYGSTRLLERLLVVALVAGVAIAAYGLYQSLIGFPPWDRQWADAVSGQSYQALYVGGTLRPWGTLSSSTEYAFVLGIGLVVAVTLLVRGRWAAALPIPLLCWALVLASTRGIIVFGLLAIVVIVVIRTPKPWMRLLVLGVSVVGIAAGQQVLAANVASVVNVDTIAHPSSNSLLTHQLGGLAYPLDPTRSTAVVHLQAIADALRNSLAHPIGLGTGATNIAGTKTGTGVGSSDVDLPDAFNNLGLAGGFVYATVIVLAFVRCGRACFKRPHSATWAVVGIMALCIGQWLTGGLYAVSALIWLVIGASNRILIDAEHKAAALPPAPQTSLQPTVLVGAARR